MKKINSIKLLLLLSMISLIMACSEKESNPTNNNIDVVGNKKGNIAPNFTTLDLAGNSVDLYSFRGNVVLIDFWATWCGPCRQTVPELVKIWNKYKSQNFKMIGVSFDSDRAALDDYIKNNSMDWIQIHDTRNDVNQYYGVTVIPDTYLIGKTGKIVYCNHPLMINLDSLIQSELSN